MTIIRKAAWQKGTLVSLDPGSNKAGLAVFRDASLLWAGPVINPTKAKGAQGWKEMAEIALRLLEEQTPGIKVDTFVMERMMFYSDPRSQKGPQSDIAELVGMAAWLGGVLGAKQTVDPYPVQWKGNMDKSVCHNRALAALTLDEKSRIELKPSAARLDVLDSVSLALWALRRVP